MTWRGNEFAAYVIMIMLLFRKVLNEDSFRCLDMGRQHNQFFYHDVPTEIGLLHSQKLL